LTAHDEQGGRAALRVLLVEDNPDDAELVLSALRREGLHVEAQRAETASAFLAALTREPDVILADYRLPQFGALEVLRLVREQALAIPVVVISGAIGEDLAVEAMKAGASDYLLKDRLGRLASAVTQAIAVRRLAAERDRLQAELAAEMQRAAEIQAQMLPAETPRAPGYAFAGVCLPARQVGGDFFDWQSDQSSVHISLGDVMGKGVAAALLMGMVRTALRVASHLSPAAGLATVNRTMFPDLAPSGCYITLFHAHLEPASGILTYVDAGHGYAFIHRQNDTVDLLRQHQLPLAVCQDTYYVESETTLAPGDTLVVYSDGLFEARADLGSDPREIVARIDGVDGAREKLARLVAGAGAGRALPDDLTLIIVQRLETPADPAAPGSRETPSR
jgi:serine phosphatase RsbU (regulator of sigma subunit)